MSEHSTREAHIQRVREALADRTKFQVLMTVTGEQTRVTLFWGRERSPGQSLPSTDQFIVPIGSQTLGSMTARDVWSALLDGVQSHVKGPDTPEAGS